jgi:hypothetical protein
VSETPGWRPLQKPVRPSGGSFAPGPFARLARLHALAAAADGLVTVALAGSIFFSISPDAARGRVLLYLFLTIAPFAVVTKFIGPAIDRVRGGRRGMILATAFARALVAFLMVSNIESIFLFPLAFALLVLQKAYAVAKSAVVPKLVDSERKLVEANSKLALLSSITSMTGAAFGALLSLIGGPGWAAGLAVLVYIAAGVAGLGIPSVVVAAAPEDAEERAELRTSGIRLAASGMGVVRGVVGFLTFLLAFELRGGKDGVDVKPDGAAAGAATAVSRHIDIVGDPGAPAWHFGAVVVAAGAGALLGARLAPQLRRRVPEEKILLGVFAATAAAGIASAFVGGITGAMLLSLAVALAGAAGKLAFDSLVQRDAPDANYGRSFARFEARFQLTWVAGALVPVALPLPERFGFVLVAGAAGFAAVTYFLGTRAAAAAPARVPPADQTLVMDHAPYDPTTVLPADGGPTPDEAPPPDEPPDATAIRDVPSPVDPTAPAAPSSPTAPGPLAPPAPPSWADLPPGPVVYGVDGVEIDPDVGRRRDVPSTRAPRNGDRDA